MKKLLLWYSKHPKKIKGGWIFLLLSVVFVFEFNMFWDGGESAFWSLFIGIVAIVFLIVVALVLCGFLLIKTIKTETKKEDFIDAYVTVAVWIGILLYIVFASFFGVTPSSSSFNATLILDRQTNRVVAYEKWYFNHFDYRCVEGLSQSHRIDENLPGDLKIIITAEIAAGEDLPALSFYKTNKEVENQIKKKCKEIVPSLSKLRAEMIDSCAVPVAQCVSGQTTISPFSHKTSAEIETEQALRKAEVEINNAVYDAAKEKIEKIDLPYLTIRVQ